MPKAEVSWKRVTDDGQKLQVYAQRVSRDWRFFVREKRFDQWAPVPEPPLEDWLLLLDQSGLLALCRPAGTAGERLSNRSLVAIRAADGTQHLAIFRSLLVQEDGSLLAWAKTLPGKATALVATGRERVTNRIVPHPAIFLPASTQTGTPASLFLPAGAMSKLVRLDVAELPDGLKVGTPLDRGSNYERLACD